MSIQHSCLIYFNTRKSAFRFIQVKLLSCVVFLAWSCRYLVEILSTRFKTPVYQSILHVEYILAGNGQPHCWDGQPGEKEIICRVSILLSMLFQKGGAIGTCKLIFILIMSVLEHSYTFFILYLRLWRSVVFQISNFTSKIMCMKNDNGGHMTFYHIFAPKLRWI